MLPPLVEIIDHELHHEVLGPLLPIIALQYESAGAGREYGYVTVQKFLKPESFVEAFGEIEIFRWKEGASQPNAEYNGRTSIAASRSSDSAISPRGST